MQAKKLIEVAMPIKEISAESTRDARIQHGHISSLHKWWARRPLPVCRAVVFASLVPDPLDENCPKAFRDGVELLLSKDVNNLDVYLPYSDIPYTSAIDKMDDNLRNRLMMFIGKFSEKYIVNEKLGKKTDSKDNLSNASLIKWESKNNEDILTKARKLIWIAYNSKASSNVSDLLNDFNNHFNEIKFHEKKLYSIHDRHLKTKEVEIAQINLQDAINKFLDKMPKTFDPFAGGSAIPLEAARLGCKSYGNDINPVAHIIQKCSLEFPQKFGKQIIFSTYEFSKIYGIETFNNLENDWKSIVNGETVGINIPNRLSFDVEYYAKKINNIVEVKIGHLYPKNEKGDQPIAYYWVRVGTCSNPSCKIEVPLLKQFYLVKTSKKEIYLSPIVNNNSIDFEIKFGKSNDKPWLSNSLICPCCGSTTSMSDLKEQSKSGKLGYRLLAVIEESTRGKTYRLPLINEIDSANINLANIDSGNYPNENMLDIPDLVSGRGWGIKKWSDMFTSRQLLALSTYVQAINDIKKELNQNFDLEYSKAIATYLSVYLDRIASRMTSFGLIDIGRETIVDPFGRQAIPMVFDFPEVNPFQMEQYSWITRVIESENFEFSSTCFNASSGENNQFEKKYFTSVITDPPYYDAIAYADLSDFFYVWLKRTLSDIYPLNFSTFQTPKTEECTALKHHHSDNKELANKHFEQKLTDIFKAIETQTSDIVSIMFAHQSTQAWSTLCNSILDSNMNITGSWAIDTEATAALKTNKAFLSSSVTVCAKPSIKSGIGDYRDVKNTIEKTVSKEVEELYRLGFRGADLLTACFGKAVSEFGKYEKVEKLDGSVVNVTDLLEMARESAFNTLLKGFDGDDFTKFYIGWLQLFGFTTNEHNTAMRIVQIGLSISINDLYRENILIHKTNESTLATFSERNQLIKNLGEKTNSSLIDQVHKAMFLFKGTSRNLLLDFVNKVAINPEDNFWRVLTSICEILPNGTDDYIQANGLLTNKESLIKESQKIDKNINLQGQLEF